MKLLSKIQSETVNFQNTNNKLVLIDTNKSNYVAYYNTELEWCLPSFECKTSIAKQSFNNIIGNYKTELINNIFTIISDTQKIGFSVDLEPSKVDLNYSDLKFKPLNHIINGNNFLLESVNKIKTDEENILISLFDKHSNVIGCDNLSLQIRTKKSDLDLKDKNEIIINKYALKAFKSFIETDKEITFAQSDSYIYFKSENHLFCQKIETQFKDYQQMTVKTFDNFVNILDVNSFKTAINLSELYSKNEIINLQINKNVMTLFASNDIYNNSFDIQIPVESDLKDFQISFNSKLLSKIVSEFKQDFQMSFNDKIAKIKQHDSLNESYLASYKND